jgi:AraC-like DNA-binding protein
LPQLLGLCYEGREYRLRFLHAGCEAGGNEARLFRQPHSHALYHIVYYTRAMGRIPLGDGRVEVAAGSMLMTGPGELHHFFPDARAPFEYLEITFRLERADGASLALPFHSMLGLLAGHRLAAARQPVSCGAALRPRIHEGMRSFPGIGSADRREAEPSFGAYTALASLFQTLLEGAVFRGEADHRIRPPEASPTDKARRYLDACFGKPPGLDRIAARAGLSPRQLQRVFKAETGGTITEYIAHLRTRRARQMLIESGLRVQEIADRLGYSSPYHFSAAFRRQTGQTPGEARRAEKRP